MTPEIGFTSNRLEGLELPENGRRYVRDSRCRNLWLQVTATGVKTFFVYRRINGRPVRFCLGRFPDLSIDSARKQADKAIGKIVGGVDPRAARRELKRGVTLGQLFADYLEHHAKPRKRTWPEDEATFNRYLAGWKNRLVSEIQRHHVATFHAKIGTDHGHYAANRLLALLHSIYSWAERDRGYSGVNPARHVQKFKEQKRARFLQPAELPAFMREVEAEPSELIRDFIKLALYTGARKGNVLAMRWDQIDFEQKLWHIPRTKSGEPVTLPLSPEALEVLQRRKDLCQISDRSSPYVLPSRNQSHLRFPYKAFKQICARAGITDLRVHDLRRTAGSWMAGAGVSLLTISKALGHESTTATAIYARVALDPVREAINTATAAIAAAAAKKDGAE